MSYLDNPVELIADHIVLPTERTYGEAMEPWQRDFFTAIFARKLLGRPKHRLVYSERRRGESKTEDSAAAALADLLTGPPAHRSYAVAADQEQAALILDSIRGFLHRSPALSSLDLLRDVCRNEATGAELRVIGSDDRTAYGIRARKVFFDELSLQRNEKLWTSMWSSVGKDPRSQMIAVSMAGWDFASLGWRIREQARENSAYFFQTRQDTELAPWLSAEDLEEQRATLHPADFARFWECRWTEPQGSWITREMYDECVTLAGPAQRREGRGAVGFVDVGLVHDATAVAVCHRDGDSVVLDELVTMLGSKTAPVELEVLEEVVVGLTERLGVQGWTFEAPQAAASVQRLQRLLPVQVELRYPTVDTQARIFGGLYTLFSTRRLQLFPHEQLRREALNLVTKVVGGRLKVVDSGVIHQDHVIAVGGAALMLAEVGNASSWLAFWHHQAEDAPARARRMESHQSAYGKWRPRAANAPTDDLHRLLGASPYAEIKPIGGLQ